jgi:hypothetical protein
MKKIKMKDIILNHYQKVHELELHGMTVRVWKPRTMQQLPAYKMREEMEVYAEEEERVLYTRNKAYWLYGNPDWGMWDALLVRYVDPRRKTLDIYFCALLIRPFSREAFNWYEGHCSGLEHIERLMLMWDSREYDRINGFDQSYGRPGNMDEWEEPLYHVTNEKEDIEDLSPDFYHGHDEDDDDDDDNRRCVKFKVTDDEIIYNALMDKDEMLKDGGTPLMHACAKAFCDFREHHPEVTEMHFYTDEKLARPGSTASDQ